MRRAGGGLDLVVVGLLRRLDAECISEIEPTGFAEHLLIGEFERTR